MKSRTSQFEQVLLQKSLWWLLDIPLELIELLSASPKITAKEEQATHNLMLRWFLNPELTRDFDFSEAWDSWFSEQPKSLFTRLSNTEQQRLCKKIEAVLISPMESCRFRLAVTTDSGDKPFFTELRCLIEDEGVKIWASSFCLNDVDKASGSNVFDESLNSFEFVHERQLLLEEQNKVVRGAFQKQSRFLALLSHELRSPLLGVQAMSKRLASKYLDFTDLQIGFSSISTTVEYLSYLINDILTYSQTEFNSVQLYPHEFFISPLLQDIQTLTQEIAEQKNLKVKIEFFGEDLPVFGDRVRLKQILINLVINSIKFTKKGYVLIQAHQEKNGQVNFKVRDTGSGISKEKLERIFEPFMQMDSASGINQFGAGLGLFVVKQLVELMNAKIRVESEVGKGTSFIFRLNLALENADLQSKKEKKRSDSSKNTSKQNAQAATMLEEHQQIEGLRDGDLNANMSIEGQTKVSAKQVVSKKPETEVLESDVEQPDSQPSAKDILDFFEQDHFVKFDQSSQKQASTSKYAKKSGAHGGALENKGREPLSSKPHFLDEKTLSSHKNSTTTRFSEVKYPKEFDALDHPAEHHNLVKVLIAEDSDLNRWVLVDLLTELGCEITETINGQEAWQAYQNGTFDLVILDIQMPIMSGIEVARNIRNLDNQAHLKALVSITAGGSESAFEQSGVGSEKLFDDWLLKPIDLEKLQILFDKYQLEIGCTQDSKQISLDELKSIHHSKVQDQDQSIKVDDGAENDLLGDLEIPQEEKVAASKVSHEYSCLASQDQYDDIPEHFLGLFADFVSQSNAAIVDIEELTKQQMWEEVAKAAHKFKGNMMLFQLNQSVKCLKNLENAVKSQENPDFKQEISDEICQNLRTLIKNLEKSHSIKDN